MIDKKKFDLVDTTLRDGEQTAGIVFSFEEKIEMVKAMNDMGISWIEAGIPAMGAEEQELLKELLNLPLESKLIAWNRAVIEDVKMSLECGFHYIHVSVPISDIHIRYKLKKDREWIKNKLETTLQYIHSHGAAIIIGAEDASRADRDFFLEIAKLGSKYGAIRIRYADTIGCLNPFTAKEEFLYLVERASLPIEFHGHNDFGMAAANSLGAYLSGIDFVSATFTGIGERAGNACMEELVMSIKKLYGFDFGYHIPSMNRLTNMVERACGRQIYEFKPIIGNRAKEFL